MPYGRLNHAQRTALAKYVRGKFVHDLGAGDLGLSHQLVELGAPKVYAIDKADKSSHFRSGRIHYKQAYFRDVTSRMDTAFVSWPANYNTELVPILGLATTIIYLGSNCDGSACGTPELFRLLVRRELLAYEPDPENSLVIVGKPLDVMRTPTGEELAGLNLMTCYSFKQAHAAG